MKLGCLSSIVSFFAMVILSSLVIPLVLKDHTQSFNAGRKVGQVAAILCIPIFFVGFAIQRRREAAAGPRDG